MSDENIARNIAGRTLWILKSDDIGSGIEAVQSGKVEGIWIARCKGFFGRDLDFLKKIKSIRALWINDANGLDLSGLEYAADLEFLGLSDTDCPFDLGQLANLKRLIFSVAKGRPLPAVGLPKLRQLGMWGFDGKDLTILKAYPELETLELIQARKLASLDGLENCQNLTELVVAYCPALLNIGTLGTLGKLQSLDFENVKKIEEYKPLANLALLKKLIIDKAAPLKNIDFVRNLRDLEHVVIRNTAILDADLSALKLLPLLSHTYMDNKKEYEPILSELKKILQTPNSD